jgi:DNA invertase Pin-like site-specific DNA recombinase
MVAIGYVRRSKESTARTVSLEEQAARIRAYAEAEGWTLAAIVTDDGVSGGKRERLARLELALREQRAAAVVVYHLDRFARDVAAMLDALRAWARRGVALYVVGRGRVEVQTAGGFLMAGVEGLMAEHFRQLIGEKTRDALARLRATGRRYSGVAPYGFRVSDDGVHLEADPAEQRALAVMRALRVAGLSYRALAGELAGRGLRQRNGAPWSAALLHRVLGRQPIERSVDTPAGALLVAVGV